MGAFNLSDLKYFVPEIALAAASMGLLLADLFIKKNPQRRTLLSGLTLVALVIVGICVHGIVRGTSSQIFSGQIVVDPLGTFFKTIFLAITAVSVIAGSWSKELRDENIAEYYALLLSITFGMFLMASANDLLTLYLGIELVSIVSFAMAGYRVRDRRSSEAALKYVVYGGAASGVMLFGISILYGMFGTTELTALNHGVSEWTKLAFTEGALATKTFPVTLLTAVVFLFAGIGYKISVVPFHMWSPDVYEGAPTPFTGFLSVGPKAAGFATLIRVFIGVFVEPGGPLGFVSDEQGWMTLSVNLPLAPTIGLLAAATMTLGNLAAIPQNNVKRLLAYSSIAHAGYLLMAFVVLSAAAIQAVIFYLVIYYVMNLGAFVVCQAIRDRNGGELISDFRGLGTREPALAAAMTVFLLSLTGLPPFAGFIGKFYLFAAVIQRGGFWYTALALVGVLNSAISLFYYLKIVKAMYLAPETNTAPFGAHRGYIFLSAALAIPTLVLGLYWTPLRTPVKNSMALFRNVPSQEMAIQDKPIHP